MLCFTFADASAFRFKWTELEPGGLPLFNSRADADRGSGSGSGAGTGRGAYLGSGVEGLEGFEDSGARDASAFFREVIARSDIPKVYHNYSWHRAHLEEALRGKLNG